MHSLRSRLFGLWLLSLVACIAVAMLLVELYQQSAEAQVARAQAVISHGCDLIKDRYGFFTSGWTGPVPDVNGLTFRGDLANVVGFALTHENGVEGGIWQSTAGPLAYAYPTYEGSGPKTDLPAAERAQIAAINRAAAEGAQSVDRQTTSRSQTLLLHGCTLPGLVPGLTAWTMTRVNAAAGFWPLLLGLAVLLSLLLGMAGWLGRTLLVWGKHVGGIEAALTGTGHDGIPQMGLTGERELDKIVNALNDAGTRLTAAKREAEAMAERAAAAEHLAGLGRMAAGVAHEIRNPIAAARLQGENALAGDDARRAEAIGDMLAQLTRLDALVTELLAMTQRVTPKPTAVDVRVFLSDCLARHATIAGAHRVTLKLAGTDAVAMLDTTMIGRALDNLLMNAIRHAPEGGEVALSSEREATTLTLVVEDSGTGISPEVAGKLFEPFVTGRPDGTGLGLAIARQLAEAHGGRLSLRRAGGGQSRQGAAFALELPWQLS